MYIKLEQGFGTMTPKERILEALSMRPPEIPPVAIFTQSATVGMMDATGATWPEANRNSKMMARLGCAQAELFGFESVRVPFDITAEAESLGCIVDLGTGCTPPSISKRAFAVDPLEGVLPDVKLLPSSDEVMQNDAMSIVIEAVSIASRRWGETHPVCAGMLGPVSLLGQLIGADNFAIATVIAPDWADDWCSALSDILKNYSKALRDSGADIITIVEGIASPDILDPCHYDSMSGRHMHVIAPGGAKIVLHICGNTKTIINSVSTSGVDAFSPDPLMNPYEIVEWMRGRVAAVGAVDPVGTLLQGSPAEVVAESHRYADAGFSVITPGCGVAPATPDENLIALSEAFGSQMRYTAPCIDRPWDSA